MKTVIIISKRGNDYFGTISDKSGYCIRNAHCGTTPMDAAEKASLWMIQYARSNVEGGDLMAPPEVLGLMPKDLINISGK